MAALQSLMDRFAPNALLDAEGIEQFIDRSSNLKALARRSSQPEPTDAEIDPEMGRAMLEDIAGSEFEDWAVGQEGRTSSEVDIAKKRMVDMMLEEGRTVEEAMKYLANLSFDNLEGQDITWEDMTIDMIDKLLAEGGS